MRLPAAVTRADPNVLRDDGQGRRVTVRRWGSGGCRFHGHYRTMDADFEHSRVEKRWHVESGDKVAEWHSGWHSVSFPFTCVNGDAASIDAVPCFLLSSRFCQEHHEWLLAGWFTMS